MLGDRLKAARKSLGLSLRDLSTQIGNKVSAQAIGKYEQGKMRPSPEILNTIAEALNISTRYLKEANRIQLGKIEFRENFTRSKKEEAQVEAKIINYLEQYLEIEELLQVETAEWDKPTGAPFPINDESDVELAAIEVRNYWRLGNDPIPNIAEFLEAKGIKVLFHDFPESVAGGTCFVHHEDFNKVPVIVVNKKITGERQRFTLTHELGHLVLEEVSPSKKNEDFCHRFASAFLMPKSILWTNLGKRRRSISIEELLGLKKILGVSVQAIAYRCKDLEIINKATNSDLFRQFTRLGWRTPPYPEPFPIDNEEASRFKRLCLRAYIEQIISADKAAEFLGKTVDTITSMADPSSYEA